MDNIKSFLLSDDLGIVAMGFILLKSGGYTKDVLVQDWKLWKTITSKKYMHLCYKYRPDLLKNFKTIYLEGCLIDSDYLFNYEKVVHLTLKGGHIPKIDDRFSAFKNLSTLEIIECGVQEISYDFSKNKNLKSLSLSINLIEKLPTTFLKNKDLFHLDLSNNKLDRLPEFMDYDKNGFSCGTAHLTKNPFTKDNRMKLRVRNLMHPTNYNKDYLYYEEQWPHLTIQ